MLGVRRQKRAQSLLSGVRVRRSPLAESEEEGNNKEDKSSVVTLALSFIHVNMPDMKGHKNYWNIELLHEHKSVHKNHVCLRHLHGRVTSEANHLLYSCEDTCKVRACHMYCMCEICHLLWLIHRGCECSFALCCNECGEKTLDMSHMVQWKASDAMRCEVE